MVRNVRRKGQVMSKRNMRKKRRIQKKKGGKRRDKWADTQSRKRAKELETQKISCHF